MRANKKPRLARSLSPFAELSEPKESSANDLVPEPSIVKRALKHSESAIDAAAAAAAKLEEKRAYNRRNAARARQRTKETIANLCDKVGAMREQCEELERLNSNLKGKVQGLQDENEQWRLKNKRLADHISNGPTTFAAGESIRAPSAGLVPSPWRLDALGSGGGIRGLHCSALNLHQSSVGDTTQSSARFINGVGRLHGYNENDGISAYLGREVERNSSSQPAPALSVPMLLSLLQHQFQPQHSSTLDVRSVSKAFSELTARSTAMTRESNGSH